MVLNRSPGWLHIAGSVLALVGLIFANWYFRAPEGQHWFRSASVLSQIVTSGFVIALMIYFSVVVSYRPITLFPLLLMLGANLYYESECLQFSFTNCIANLNLNTEPNIFLSYLNLNLTNVTFFLFLYMTLASLTRVLTGLRQKYKQQT